MTAKKVVEAKKASEFIVPIIKEGKKVKGTVLKKIAN
jgi:hypothetical protein